MAKTDRHLTYEEVAQGIGSLTTEEHLKLLELISSLLRKRIAEKPVKERNIIELEGLGAEIWNGMDAQEYVRRERESWD